MDSTAGCESELDSAAGCESGLGPAAGCESELGPAVAGLGPAAAFVVSNARNLSRGLVLTLA